MGYQTITFPCCISLFWPEPGEPKVVIGGLVNNYVVLDTTDLSNKPLGLQTPFCFTTISQRI